MLAEQGPRGKVNIRSLWNALRFLAKDPKGRDANDRTKTCTCFQDDYAMAADSSRRGNAVVLVAKLPQLRFPVTVCKSDAETIATWLRVVSKDLGPEVSEVEITDLTATFRPRYCFRDPTSKHWLWISAMSRPFQRAVIDPTLAITPRFAVEAAAQSSAKKDLVHTGMPCFCPNRFIEKAFLLSRQKGCPPSFDSQ
jgi:hypothetical protein